MKSKPLENVAEAPDADLQRRLTEGGRFHNQAASAFEYS